MLSFSIDSRRVMALALLTGAAVGAGACTVYDVDSRARMTTAGASGAGGAQAGVGGASGNGGTANTGHGGAGSMGSGGSTGGEGGSWSSPDASTGDVVTSNDTSTGDVRGDATDAGEEGGADDVDLSDAVDAPSDGGNDDAAIPPIDATSDAPPGADATADTTTDTLGPDTAETGAGDADSGSTGVQILPLRGTPIIKPDAGAQFDSRCAGNEVVTGFIARVGVQTDAIAATCSTLSGGVLSSPHNLPLNGNSTGGSPVTITCPANYVAVGIVGRYGHSTMWMEDITTSIGVVCKNLGSTATQTVAVTSQNSLDSGYTSFREDCTGGRYLTDISGRPDSNSLAYTVGQVGGECSVR